MDWPTAFCLALIVFFLFRAGHSTRRRAQRQTRKRLQTLAEIRTAEMMALKYAPTPLTTAPEPRHWADDIPYPIALSESGKKDV
jgi:hypothetical protein